MQYFFYGAVFLGAIAIIYLVDPSSGASTAELMQ